MMIIAAQNSDSQQRLISSSGAIFPLIARKCINADGIVYGAAFGEDYAVRHVRVTTLDELKKLYGSKYVYSDLNQSYQSCKKDLDMGKEVVFVGTPCQISGLKRFLKRPYNNLFLIDFICHGAPSQDIWKKYISEIKGKKEIAGISFRDKRDGWEKYSISIRFTDGTEYIKNHDDDLYLAAFIGNLILRKACYNCSWKGIQNRESDITLGDLWGAKELAPDLYDDKGTSLLFINTDKGATAFTELEQVMQWCEIDSERAIQINSASIQPSKPSVYYEQFNARYKNGENLLSILKSYYQPTMIQRIKNKIYRKLK